MLQGLSNETSHGPQAILIDRPSFKDFPLEFLFKIFFFFSCHFVCYVKLFNVISYKKGRGKFLLATSRKIIFNSIATAKLIYLPAIGPLLGY
jgi:hypothetical protein